MKILKRTIVNKGDYCELILTDKDEEKAPVIIKFDTEDLDIFDCKVNLTFRYKRIYRINEGKNKTDNIVHLIVKKYYPIIKKFSKINHKNGSFLDLRKENLSYQINDYEEKEDYTILKIKNKTDERLHSIKIDTENVPFIKEYMWIVAFDNFLQISTTLNGGKFICLQNFILGTPKDNQCINFVNLDKTDFRESNLVFGYSVFNRSLSINNNSGITGVCLIKDKGIESRWLATIEYNNKNGKYIKKKKSFSINKYGFYEAKDLAISKRKEFEKEYLKEFEKEL